VDETALAVDALAGLLALTARDQGPAAVDGARLARSVRAGVRWLVERTDCGREFEAAPIGFYFARLWYFERMYPIAFTLGALARAREVFLR
jgi:squalene-hopene/tetraprenyl-beta-curcumene cyclase